MSKIWGNEPTPMTNSAPGISRYEQKPVRHYVSIEFARDIERRLRHAERLLADLLSVIDYVDPQIMVKYGFSEEKKAINDAYAHLEAAKEEANATLSGAASASDRKPCSLCDSRPSGGAGSVSGGQEDWNMDSDAYASAYDDLESDLAAVTKERDEAQAKYGSLYARHTRAILALLEAHQYYANGSDALARDTITRFLKARLLVDDDGVTWTREALEIAGDNFNGGEDEND